MGAQSLVLGDRVSEQVLSSAQPLIKNGLTPYNFQKQCYTFIARYQQDFVTTSLQNQAPSTKDFSENYLFYCIYYILSSSRHNFHRKNLQLI